MCEAPLESFKVSNPCMLHDLKLGTCKLQYAASKFHTFKSLEAMRIWSFETLKLYHGSFTNEKPSNNSGSFRSILGPTPKASTMQNNHFSGLYTLPLLNPAWSVKISKLQITACSTIWNLKLGNSNLQLGCFTLSNPWMLCGCKSLKLVNFRTLTIQSIKLMKALRIQYPTTTSPASATSLGQRREHLQYRTLKLWNSRARYIEPYIYIYI